MAAVLYAGPDAVLSYRSAAALLGLIDRARSIDVTRTGSPLSRPALTIHASRSLVDEDRISIDQIPVTSPTRTLIDLAGIESARALDDRLSAARRRGLLDCQAVREALGRVPNRKGAGKLRRLLRLYETATKASRSELETRFLRLCFDAGLPMPEPDVRVGQYFADLLWREQRLIAEIDSRTFHHHRFEEDRIRDIDNLTAGYRTIRVTDRMLKTAPGQLVASVRTLLGGT
jgi:very-short-patch-repair endonuclease